MRNIAVIPARSGSKSLLDKNIKELDGYPLIYYSVKAALDSGQFSKVFVSTDSEKYAEIAKKCGADASFLRSRENADDTSSSWDAVKEVIAIFEQNGEQFDNIMLLQPTSPLRTAKDILNAFTLFGEKEANSIVSVTEAEHSPLWCNTLPESLCMDDFEDESTKGISRQQLPKYYRINGAIYLFKTDELYKPEMFKNKCFAYIMSQENSIDIDTELDFKFAELILNNLK